MKETKFAEEAMEEEPAVERERPVKKVLASFLTQILTVMSYAQVHDSALYADLGEYRVSRELIHPD